MTGPSPGCVPRSRGRGCPCRAACTRCGTCGTTARPRPRPPLRSQASAARGTADQRIVVLLAPLAPREPAHLPHPEEEAVQYGHLVGAALDVGAPQQLLLRGLDHLEPVVAAHCTAFRRLGCLRCIRRIRRIRCRCGGTLSRREQVPGYAAVPGHALGEYRLHRGLHVRLHVAGVEPVAVAGRLRKGGLRDSRYVVGGVKRQSVLVADALHDLCGRLRHLL